MPQNWKTKFILLWSGQAVSILTSSILQMAIVWYLTEKTGSAAILSFATLIGFLPQAILGTFIGVYIDRYNRKTIMILSDLFIAGASLILVVVGFWGEIPIWLIIVVLFIRSIGTAFHYPSLQAVTPLIVPKDQLTKYAGYSQSFESVSMVASPAISAVLFGLWDLNIIILLDVFGAMFAVFMLCIVEIPKLTARAECATPHVIKEVREGLSILNKEPGTTALLAISALYAVIYFPIGTLYPLITMTYFGGTFTQSSVVEVVFSFGMLTGSLLLGILGRKINKIRAISGSIAVYGAGVLLTGLLPPNGFYVFIILSAIMGVSVPFYTGVEISILQMKIKEEYLGRILSLSASISMVAMPLGLVLSGTFAEVIGVEKWFLFSGIFTLILAVVSLIIPSLKHCCDN
ncbi:DHA3 family macrolide efflux protein-like MFS transporter [Hydrogenoanaerobacterium saccharovorans]|uniref:MFS transporter, DHA3 family, macrolide efflux protein n=1 Tax=Hydrogenoanaerobacterium saccharovorans TaxID=474960 RepID=A0A1H8BLW2_9FIRM|nr:MFS transporter [Hydrogenoanaerobacterium saccharovorans]RPF47336.1 DHA3 family macrolide efflux protein-like MFS transporter [Hydrogenoanaerobacterium saccharovorans]SEM83880.1 MFS transporter, DHA3 family, macrolide efflux protein [Hydrogenoanaerobacterium saccharovorans]